jgi:hypothetical protein
LDQPAIDLRTESELHPTNYVWIGSVENGALTNLWDLLQVRGQEANVFTNERCGDRRGDSCLKKGVQEAIQPVERFALIFAG